MELLGEGFAPRTEVVGAARPGILLDLTQVVVGAEALEDAVPEGDQGSKSPVVKGSGAEG